MAISGVLWGVIALVGASIGSFITLITYRLPRDEKVGMTRSRCPQCGTTLGIRDLVPILSWIVSRGRCRHCAARVGIRYPLTELVCAAGALGAAATYGLTLEAFALAGLWWSIVALTITDLEEYIILDEVQVAIIIFGVLYHYALGTSPLLVGVAAAFGLGIGLVLKYGFLFIRKKDGLGLGDVKFLFGAGLWLGDPASLVPFLFYAGVVGTVFGLCWRLVSRGKIFPFGPALAGALFACVVDPALPETFWQFYHLHPDA